MEAAMAAHSLRRPDLMHGPALDWFLILVGALFAWLIWPGTHP
jgi:hypothetical protein